MKICFRIYAIPYNLLECTLSFFIYCGCTHFHSVHSVETYRFILHVHRWRWNKSDFSDEIIFSAALKGTLLQNFVPVWTTGQKISSGQNLLLISLKKNSEYFRNTGNALEKIFCIYILKIQVVSFKFEYFGEIDFIFLTNLWKGWFKGPAEFCCWKIQR